MVTFRGRCLQYTYVELVCEIVKTEMKTQRKRRCSVCSWNMCSAVAALSHESLESSSELIRTPRGAVSRSPGFRV